VGGITCHILAVGEVEFDATDCLNVGSNVKSTYVNKVLYIYLCMYVATALFGSSGTPDSFCTPYVGRLGIKVP